MKKPKNNTNLIAVLANIEIEELAIEGQTQNAYHLKVDALDLDANSKKDIKQPTLKKKPINK